MDPLIRRYVFPAVACALTAVFTSACGEGSATAPDASADVATPAPVAPSFSASTGNGFVSGPHYNLNIIGVPKDKSPNFTGGSGGRIFVPLVGSTKIMLFVGPTYEVLDANGTDGSASFQLPNPDPTNSGTSNYSVYARALGKPGGSALIQTCATDPATGDVVCSTYTTLQVRGTGQSKATNVTKQLLYLYTDVVTGTLTRYPIFDARLEGYFWSYDNSGLKLLQLRFYPVSTVVP